MNEDQLSAAAFWDRAVCLDCNTESDSPDEVCPACGSDAIYSATLLLRIIEWSKSE